MAKDLNEYLEQYRREGGPREFKPTPRYFPCGDYITYYIRDERCYEQRVDELVTVYLSMASDELIGCKIKGVKHVLETAGDFGVAVDGEGVRLGLFFFVGAVAAKDDKQARRYEELRRLAKDAKVDDGQLTTC